MLDLLIQNGRVVAQRQDFTVKALTTAADRRRAIELVKKYHYLRSLPPPSEIFGLFPNNPGWQNDIYGVALYGVSQAPTVRDAFGPPNATRMYELMRVWVAERMPGNVTSFLVQRSLKIQARDIIISYADSSVGHFGTIYQACNFVYTGTSQQRYDYTIKGSEHLHHTTVTKGKTVAELRREHGDENVVKVPRTLKHRYVWFRHQADRQYLKWRVLPYPKPSLNVAPGPTPAVIGLKHGESEALGESQP